MPFFVNLSRRSAILLFCVLICTLTGCLVHRRQKIAVASPTAAPVWQTASLSDLLAKIKARQDAIQTLDLTATIEPSVTSPSKGELVTYHDVRTFIIVRKPALIRMIGLYPVVQNKAFDMSSDGDTFRLYIPLKNRFIIGKDHEEPRPFKSGLESLRPQHILDALLVRGPEPGQEEAAVEVVNNRDGSFYVVHIMQTLPEHRLLLARNIWFERRGLTVSRQQIFDESGEVVTDVHYSEYTDFSGVSYPKQVTVDRPKDLYGLHLMITKLDFNEPVGNDKFILEQPPGTQLIHMDRLSAPEKEKNKVG